MLWNEWRKILCSRKSLLLLALICIIGGVLLHARMDGGYAHFPEEYREVYKRIEGMSPQDAYAWILEQRKNGREYGYWLYERVSAELRLTASYQEYRDGIAESAKRLSQISIFQKKDGFSARSIKKMAQRYEKMPEVETVVSASRGVVMAASFQGTDLLAVFFVIWIVFSMVARERELGQLLLTKTTYYGHARHAAVKLAVAMSAAVVAVLAMEAVNLVMAEQTYGLGDLRRSIQSVPEYRASILPVSVGEFLVLFVLLKILSVCCIAAVSFLIASKCRSYFGMAAGFVGTFAVEGACFLFIPGNSIFGIFRYINLFAGLEADRMLGDCVHLNFFGQPVWYLPAGIGAFCLAGAVAGVCGVRAYAKLPPLAVSRGGWKHRLVLFPEKTLSLFWHELYKLLFGEKVVLLIAAAAAFIVGTYHPMREIFTDFNDMYFKQYMLQLEGMYGPGKDEEIEAEQAAYDAATQEMLAALEKNPEAAPAISSKYAVETEKYQVLERVRDHAQYLKEHHGAFVYDTGYRILVNDDIGKKDQNRLAIWVNLLMVLCTGFLFSADCQSGVDRLQRATWRGRGALVLRKVLIGTLVLAVVFALVYVPFVHNVFQTYGTQALTFPACSLTCLGNVKPGISIGAYLAGFYALRYLFLWGKMNLLFWLATKLRSCSYTIVVGIGMFVGPLLLFYL